MIIILNLKSDIEDICAEGKYFSGYEGGFV